MPDKSDRNERALRILIERGIISEDKTMGDLLKASREVAEIFKGSGGSPDFWMYIGPYFCFFGTDPIRRK